MANNIVKVELDTPKILNKVENDEFGLFLAREWKKIVNPFTPKQSGYLESNVDIRPFEIEYLSRYAHYMYEGIVYIDPQYKVGGFTNDGGVTWWSRPGVQKIPSGRRFNYNTDQNPFATDHWDEKAEMAGQVDKLITEVNNNYFKNRSD